jgi:hypothetical protein
MATLPCADLRHDTLKQSATAQEIAAALCRLCFDHGLPHVDPQTRLELMQLAEDAVSKAVDEHALADVVPFCPMDAYKLDVEGDR